MYPCLVWEFCQGMQDFLLYNSKKRVKEKFVPLKAPHVGLYVCGPTVYGEPHLGHARPAITFDVLFRYLTYLGYQVRYVRNITDVGHLQHDSDDGEDKVLARARVEQLEPMEIAHRYTVSYHQAMDALNVLTPSIEPRATGHIVEQIDLIKKLLKQGYAYEVNGSVYFDLSKYSQSHDYGVLSHRKVEELLEATRSLSSQNEKKNNVDFALWKRADSTHIMAWSSPWGKGYPGWHTECVVMSTKYLGETFDIHGGGIDLLFPHHEAELAQSKAAFGNESARWWMHNNMITINGQKMGKSLENFITLPEFFSGGHEALKQPISPMAIRFFILQAHYRSELDFSEEALISSEKGFKRLMEAQDLLNKLSPSSSSSVDVDRLEKAGFEALNDDLSTPLLLSSLFEWVKIIYAIKQKKETISSADLTRLRQLFSLFVNDILGLEKANTLDDNHLLYRVVQILIDLRTEARQTKNWELSDRIRDRLGAIGVQLKDETDTTVWEIE